MVVAERNEGSPSHLAARHVDLARRIAARLRRSYSWLCADDLHGYAFLGVSLAARAFDAERGVPFDRFALCKGTFLAIDEMRRDGVLQRRRGKVPIVIRRLSGDVPDPKGDRARKRMENRDIFRSFLGKVKPAERQLMLMYYADQMTFKEIARVFRITESAVCFRHKALIRKLRKLAKVREQM